MDTKVAKAMNAVRDAQQHLSSILDYEHLDCVYIDRMLAKIVDLPTESKQKNTRRNIQTIRSWMITDGPGVALLEVLGQLYWRLGDLNGKEFEILKDFLHQQESYLDLVQDPRSTALVMQRVKCVQEFKLNAFDLLIRELDSKCNPCKGRALSNVSGSRASSPASRSTKPHPQPMTRTSSTSNDSLESGQSPRVTDVRNDNAKSTLWYSDVPISPDSGIVGNWNLPKNDFEHVLINFCISPLPSVQINNAHPAKT